MKVLFVTLRALEINSSVTISNLGLLNGLLQMGCEIDLLMPDVNKDLKQYDNIENLEGNINILRIKHDATYDDLVVGKSTKIKKMIVNILRKCFYKINLYDNTIRLVNKADISLLRNKKYDLVISTSDPKTSHMFINKLIKQGLDYDIWLQHWGDPLSNDITSNTIYPQNYIKAQEKKLFSCADLLIYVSPLTAIAQKNAFPKYEKKIHFVPLPYDKEKKYELTKNKKITIGYFGDYSSTTRNIMPLYDLCLHNSNYYLIIAGGTDISLSERENIKILPRVTQVQIDELEAKCDILVCICNRSGTQIPGKIYYYSGTNRPILVVLDGIYKKEIGAFLSKYNRFYICDNNSESINKKIEIIADQGSINSPCKDFSPLQVANQLLSFVEEKLREKENV